MSSTSQDYISLFNRLLEGELSPQDADALIKWLGSENLDPVAAELILAQLRQPVVQEQITPDILSALEAKLPAILGKPAEQPLRPIHYMKSLWLRYAAAVILLLGMGAYLWLLIRPSKQAQGDKIVSSKLDISPGRQGAILTLADGRTVVLDSIGNGLIATQNGTKVLLNDGQLTYNADRSAVAAVAYNTMTTPKGRQFQLVLPDGTKVWLNAASSVRYPTVFTGNERKVEITGEAYFEVTKNAKMPFRVKVNDQTEIEVLGTHFNVNSYTNEASINTTLLEGSVQITNSGKKVVIKPGQQAQVAELPVQPGIKILSDVDVDKVMAWKNGVFNFQDATLKEVMRQLERWYDIEVVYEKGVPDLEFMGTMGRDLSLSDVLSGLKLSEVHFRIEEGRKLIVMP
ncbi:MAG: FecR domain-containing protein [Bacteroidota bacterium]|nr:FecR domain-containing protein [Bacteroidota bacterium]